MTRGAASIGSGAAGTLAGILAGTVIVIVTTAVYAGSANNYFAQDDFGVVGLLSQKPAGYFPRWFTSNWMDAIWGGTPDEIRPFPAVSYQMTSAFGAAWPLPHHLLNIALHAATAWLVLAVARTSARLGVGAAAVGALAFVIFPNQAETVAWITGRVDGLPAFVYTAAVLAYARWRASGSTRTTAYVSSLVLCFVALFSKQTAITLAPALVLYDLIIERRPVRLSWAWIRPYVPFVLLTAAFLLLRQQLFNTFVREEELTGNQVRFGLNAIAGHLTRLLAGSERLDADAARVVVGGVLAAAVVWLALALRHRTDATAARPLLFFGVVWTILGVAPSLVAGYTSPRHAYLASIGWAITLGLGFGILWNARPSRLFRPLAVALTTAILGGYGVQLAAHLREWERLTATSAQAVTDLEREVSAAAPGTLVLAGVPHISWVFAMPYATRPPFTREDLGARVSIITPASLHCCGRALWEMDAREKLRAWSARADRPPVVGMYWDERTGTLSRVADADDPSLRMLIGLLGESADAAALDANVLRLLREYVAFHSPRP